MKLSCLSILFSSFLLFFFSSDISASLVISITSRVNLSDVIVALNGGQGNHSGTGALHFRKWGKRARTEWESEGAGRWYTGGIECGVRKWNREFSMRFRG